MCKPAATRHKPSVWCRYRKPSDTAATSYGVGLGSRYPLHAPIPLRNRKTRGAFPPKFPVAGSNQGPATAEGRVRDPSGNEPTGPRSRALTQKATGGERLAAGHHGPPASEARGQACRHQCPCRSGSGNRKPRARGKSGREDYLQDWGRMTSTGSPERLTRVDATLPIIHLESPVRPWVVIAIRLWGVSCAKFRRARAVGPAST